MEYESGEGHWIKLEEQDETPNSFRIIGGWKPNDPTANGRKQKATLVICNTDGTDREEYTVVRRNWGLPVTYLNGVWWCKYNAMGDSKNFSDQILSSNDPAAKAGKTLLITCATVLLKSSSNYGSGSIRENHAGYGSD